MNQSLCNHLKHLRSALLSLSATGNNGFEGLVGVALREISGVPFRLAGSGSQFGIDGKAAYEEDAICFECKRYSGTVPRTEVLSKIAELSINDNESDVWVLGATSQIKSQLADDARNLGAKNGVVILILDWSDAELPPLAVALTLGDKRVINFLERNISDYQLFQDAQRALEEIKNSNDFTTHANRIRKQCNESSVGLSLAQRANADWLTDAFTNRTRAKIKLGQPLSPGDTNAVSVRQRKTLNDKLNTFLNATSREEKVICILGGEGSGKSWIVAQNWLAMTHKPLMIFISSEDFSEANWQNNAIDFLITKIIKQTGNVVTEATQKRWRRKIERWRNNLAEDNPRLIVIMDGINQRPQYDWARIIDSIGDELYQLGGHLIVTARTSFFRDHIKNRLSVPFDEIQIPEWTAPERDEILAEHEIKASDLHHAVAASLCSPRLLGIALELFDKADVISFEELSTSRLLFEHIRISDRDSLSPQPAFEFAKKLQNHAQEILSRIEKKQQDDLNIFESDMSLVADGRFFQAVEGDPARYSLKDGGLTLALGFSVIDRLRTAQRNNRNLDAEIGVILEPIAALDDAADVVIAALTVAVAENRDVQDIVISLVKGFVDLQNPDEAKFPAFTGLLKTLPDAFMKAARTLSLTGGHQLNFDWIRGALIIAGRNRSVWQHMVNHVHDWLSVYSLSLDRGTFRLSTYDQQENEKREKDRKNIENKFKALSENDQIIFGRLLEEEGNLSRLSDLALLLLAGKSLTPFAKSLLNWSFSNALNSDHSAPYKNFIDLVRLNRIDWSQTRVALLKECEVLREADVSKTGKWAMVNILRATGQTNDAIEARDLVLDLTKDQKSFKGWRLIEDYCATDPCDPVSEQPENVIQTSEQYAAIDVSKLKQSMSQATEDHFFNGARLGIVRFKPEIAVAKHKEFITDVLSRTGTPLRQGLFELRKHNALLTNSVAHEFTKKWRKLKTASKTGDQLENEDTLVSQYHLLLAFPFLSAKEQFDILLLNGAAEGILCDLINITKPLDEEEFEHLLGKACDEDNEHKQYLLLVLANDTLVHLSVVTCNHIVSLLQSKSERVREQALGVIAQSDNINMLKSVVESDWSTPNDEDKKKFEAWYGSIALLNAAINGLIAHDKALDRISARLYGQAAVMLDDNAVNNIARRIDASINLAIGLNNDLAEPDIDIQIYSTSPYEPNRVNVGDPEIKNNLDKMRRLAENNEAFLQRQKHNHDAYIKYEANLTKAKAHIILDAINLKEFSAIVEKNELFTNRWYKLFMSIDDTKLPAVHNLILLLAHALNEKTPDRAKELFNRIKNSKPLICFTFGRSGVLLDSMSIWAGVRNTVMDELRFTRLDRMRTDHDLANEVLVALLNDQQELLTEYIKTKLNQDEPAENARGIMVAGFSDQSAFNDKVIKKYEDSVGLIGSAQQAAKYAYERNAWARHWFEKMSQANENTGFWCFSILFSKVVDGRSAVWRSQFTQKGNPIMLFGPSINSGLKNHFDRWKNNRKKKLFGSDVPELIFLEGADD